MGCEAGVLSPTHDVPEELDLNSGIKKRNRRSFGGKSVPREGYLFWENYSFLFVVFFFEATKKSCIGASTIKALVAILRYVQKNGSGSL